MVYDNTSNESESQIENIGAVADLVRASTDNVQVSHIDGNVVVLVDRDSEPVTEYLNDGETVVAIVADGNGYWVGKGQSTDNGYDATETEFGIKDTAQDAYDVAVNAFKNESDLLTDGGAGEATSRDKAWLAVIDLLVSAQSMVLSDISEGGNVHKNTARAVLHVAEDYDLLERESAQAHTYHPTIGPLGHVADPEYRRAIQTLLAEAKED